MNFVVEYASTLLRSFKRTGWVIGMCMIPLMGMAQVTGAEYADSLRFSLPNLSNDTLKVKTYLSLASYYMDNQADSGLKYANLALDLSRAFDYTMGLARGHNSAGMIYSDLKLQEKALIHYHKSLELYQALNDEKSVGFAYNNIGVVLMDLASTDQAVENFEKSHQVFLENGFEKEATYPRHNMASMLNDNGEHEKALEIYESNLLIHEEIGNERLLAVSFNNIGRVYHALGDDETALGYYRRSLALKVGLNNQFGIANTLNNIGEALVKTGRISDAEDTLTLAFDLATKMEAKDIVMESYLNRSLLYETKGEYQLALAAYKEYVEMEKTLLDQESANRMVQMQGLFDLEQKESRIALQGSELIVRNVVILGLLGVLLLLFSGAFLLWRNNQSRLAINQELEEKNAMVQAQQDLIMAKNEDLSAKYEQLEALNQEKDGLMNIVAHDLKAPLNRSTGLAEMIMVAGELNKDQQQFITLIKKVNADATELVRNLLDLNHIEQEREEPVVAEFELDKLLADSVEGFRFQAEKKQIQLHLNRESTVPVKIVSHEGHIARIIDNLMSNAIKFSPQGGNVYLQIQEAGSQVGISVMDEGPGISEADKLKMFKKFQKLSAQPTAGESSTGLGLAITKALTTRLRGEVKVEDNPNGGARFMVCLPARFEPISDS